MAKTTALAARSSVTTALARYKYDLDTLRGFVKKTLKEGVDWGLPDPAAKKPALWKSGSEKIRRNLGCRSFSFVDQPIVDSVSEVGDTVFLHVYWVPEDKVPWIPRLMGGEAGPELTFEQACSLVAITDGRGAGDPREGVVRTRNVAVKKAEIRAEKDAALRLGLSDIFTQDIGEVQGSPDDEDIYELTHHPSAPEETPKPAPKPAAKKEGDTQHLDLTKKAHDLIMAKTSGGPQKVFLDSLRKATDSANFAAIRAMIASLDKMKQGGKK